METKKRVIILLIFGNLFIIVGLIFLCGSPFFITNLVHNKLSILPNNPGFILWRDMNIPIYQNFYMFNITNSNEVRNGAKPNLEQIGPFVYKVNISKSALQFNNDSTEVTFLEKKQYYFQPNLTKIPLNTTITTLNVPLITVAKLINSPNISPPIRQIIRFILKHLVKISKIDLFITGTVEELLFLGKYNQILRLLYDLNLTKDSEFCFMKNQNNSLTGPYKIFTGKDNINLLNTIITYMDSDKLTYWSDDCNYINGSNNGELFPPADQFGGYKSYRFYRPEFCRVFNLTLNETDILSDVHSLRTDRFKLDHRSFQNATQYPPNACYKPNVFLNKTMYQFDNKTLATLFQKIKIPQNLFQNLDDNDNSLFDDWEKPSGVFDLSPCQQNAPIYLSFPHFLDADNYYLQQINGLKPNPSKHESYIDIEPQTGTPVDFIARIQINVDVDFARMLFPNVKSLLLPVLWQEFAIHITDEIAQMIESQTKKPMIISISLSTIILVIGILMILYAFICLVLKFIHLRQSVTLNDDSEDSLINREANVNPQTPST